LDDRSGSSSGLSLSLLLLLLFLLRLLSALLLPLPPALALDLALALALDLDPAGTARGVCPDVVSGGSGDVDGEGGEGGGNMLGAGEILAIGRRSVSFGSGEPGEEEAWPVGWSWDMSPCWRGRVRWLRASGSSLRPLLACFAAWWDDGTGSTVARGRALLRV
jgi:hypothetical protein